MSNNNLQKLLKVVNEFELILNLSSELSSQDLETLQAYFRQIVIELIKTKYKLGKHIRVNTLILSA